MTDTSTVGDRVARGMYIILGTLFALVLVIFFGGGWWVSHKCLTDKPASFCAVKKVKSFPGFPH